MNKFCDCHRCMKYYRSDIESGVSRVESTQNCIESTLDDTCPACLSRTLAELPRIDSLLSQTELALRSGDRLQSPYTVVVISPPAQSKVTASE